MSETRQVVACTPRYVPSTEWARSIKNAIEANPDNRPDDFDDALLAKPSAEHEKIAVDVQRYWGKQGVKLSVGFIETPDTALRARILSHMNAWGRTANVSFVEASTDPKVRIARFTAAEAPERDGYWSDIATDILSIDKYQPTMNLEAFTMDTVDSEFHRVVRHETGHTLGFPHEHMRKAIVARLDREKVIASFMRTQGWSKQEVIDQILTPLEESSILGTPKTDDISIMCYQIDGSLTLDSTPVLGGTDINALDAKFAGQIYPKPHA